MEWTVFVKPWFSGTGAWTLILMKSWATLCPTRFRWTTLIRQPANALSILSNTILESGAPRTRWKSLVRNEMLGTIARLTRARSRTLLWSGFYRWGFLREIDENGLMKMGWIDPFWPRNGMKWRILTWKWLQMSIFTIKWPRMTFFCTKPDFHKNKHYSKKTLFQKNPSARDLFTGNLDTTLAHADGFNPAVSCVNPEAPNRGRECCGTYPNRFQFGTGDGKRKCCFDKTFDAESTGLQCCPDGEILSNCSWLDRWNFWIYCFLLFFIVFSSLEWNKPLIFLFFLRGTTAHFFNSTILRIFSSFFCISCNKS